MICILLGTSWSDLLLRKGHAMNEHKTAIVRRKISSPARYLRDNGRLIGRTLDYGCGKGFDADTLGMEGYDPYYRSVQPTGTYDTITCTYVLNVIEDEAIRLDVLACIAERLSPGGTAYISVRADVKKDGHTSKGTYQADVRLPLPVVVSNKQFRMYTFSRCECGQIFCPLDMKKRKCVQCIKSR